MKLAEILLSLLLLLLTLLLQGLDAAGSGNDGSEMLTAAGSLCSTATSSLSPATFEPRPSGELLSSSPKALLLLLRRRAVYGCPSSSRSMSNCRMRSC
jgi:hypothetical protein